MCSNDSDRWQRVRGFISLLFRISLKCACTVYLYFFIYKTEFFSFQNNPKTLDPSFKMDLDLWDCLGRVKLVLHVYIKISWG